MLDFCAMPFRFRIVFPQHHGVRGVAVASLLFCATAGAGVRKGPYLIYGGVQTEMTVLWQLDTAAECRLAWGADTNCAAGTVASTEYGADHQHAVTLAGLTPGATYHYRVTEEGREHPGTFRAAPPAGCTSTRFVACGDSRSDPASYDRVNAAILALVADQSEFQNLLLHTGDRVVSDSETYWQDQFFGRAWPNTLAVQAAIPINGNMGNHEGAGAGFVKYCPYPFAGARYWSFDYGPAHIAVVDQYVSYSAGSAQHTWLAADLAGTAQPWKFLVLHEPGWGAMAGRNNVTVQNTLQPLCVSHGVQIILAGHNHHYSRCVVDGVQHVTTGSAGAPLYNVDLGMPYLVAATRAYSLCKVEIEANLLTLTAVALDSSVLDRFTLTNAVLPTVQFQSPDSTEDEHGAAVPIGVWLSAPQAGTVQVDYSVGGGTATGPADYTPADGVLTFAAGETNGWLMLSLLDDAAHEADETVVLSLSDPQNAVLGSVARHTLTIRDEEGTAGDYDGDGRADPALFHTEAGTWYVLRSAAGLLVLPFGWHETLAVPADYDGDGLTDPAVYAPASGTWYILGSGGGFRAVQFGSAAPTPVPADYDGDERADPAVYHAPDGLWYILASRDGFRTSRFGWSAAVPVQADYDGDGRADPAVYHGAAGAWSLLRSAAGFGAAQFGWSEPRPVPADYDGDGQADPALYHGPSGMWYILRSRDGFRTERRG